MYSPVAEVLDHIFKRLDQIQSQNYKLDHVIASLDRLNTTNSLVISKLQTICDLAVQWNLSVQMISADREKFSQAEIRDDTKNVSMTQVASSESIRADNFKKFKVDLEQVKTSVTLIASSFDSIENKISAIDKRIEELETSLNIGHTTVINEVATLKHLHDHVTTQCEQSTSDIKDYIYRNKREIFSVIEKEAQIVRDRIKGPLPSLGKYTFDFYVENFKKLIRSGKEIDSVPWHINELKSCVKGYAAFNKNGLMEVCILCARHPREVGLEPRSGITLTVKATVCDIYKKMLPDVRVGEKTWPMKEMNIPRNTGYGVKLGVVSCDQLVLKGYGEIEGYWFGSVLIRFDVTIL